MDKRPMRGCDACGGVDDHPRHVFDATGIEGAQLAAPKETVAKAYENAEGVPLPELVAIIRDLEDATVQTRHMDCCAEAGCPDGTCDEILKRTKNAHGLDLVAAITGEKVK